MRDLLFPVRWRNPPPVFQNAEGGFIGATATTTTQKPEPLSTLTLECMARLVALVPPDPIAEMMTLKGYPPERGWVMLLPDADQMRAAFGDFPLPHYVRFSSVLLEPTFVFTGGMPIDRPAGPAA